MILGILCATAAAQESKSTKEPNPPLKQVVASANDKAETSLQRALHFADLYNWHASRPYFIEMLSHRVPYSDTVRTRQDALGGTETSRNPAIGFRTGKRPVFILISSSPHERMDKKDRILVWEMKEDQLEGNLDTAYKRRLLEIISTDFRTEDGLKAGTLELIGRTPDTVECDLVLISQWTTKASSTFAKGSREARD